MLQYNGSLPHFEINTTRHRHHRAHDFPGGAAIGARGLDIDKGLRLERVNGLHVQYVSPLGQKRFMVEEEGFHSWRSIQGNAPRSAISRNGSPSGSRGS
jgi:hypothetical protein